VVGVEEIDPADVVSLEDLGEFLDRDFKRSDIGCDAWGQMTQDMFPTESAELIIPDGKVAKLGLGFVRDIEDGCRPRMADGDGFDDETTVVGIDLAKLTHAVRDGLNQETSPAFVGKEDVAAWVAGDAIVGSHLDKGGKDLGDSGPGTGWCLKPRGTSCGSWVLVGEDSRGEVCRVDEGAHPDTAPGRGWIAGPIHP